MKEMSFAEARGYAERMKNTFRSFERIEEVLRAAQQAEETLGRQEKEEKDAAAAIARLKTEQASLERAVGNKETANKAALGNLDNEHQQALDEREKTFRAAMKDYEERQRAEAEKTAKFEHEQEERRTWLARENDNLEERLQANRAALKSMKDRLEGLEEVREDDPVSHF